MFQGYGMSRIRNLLFVSVLRSAKDGIFQEEDFVTTALLMHRTTHNNAVSP